MSIPAPQPRHRARALFDLVAVGFAIVFGPLLRTIARSRMGLPRFQAHADRAGFQLRGPHYYEPTYAEEHLPADTTGERLLPGVDLNAAAQLALLARFAYADELRAFPQAKPSPAEFGYVNQMFGPGDAEIYYSIIRTFRPRRIVEIGSGNSTLMALQAIAANRVDDATYRCDVTCIEPYEMPWLESTGVTVVRERVETVALSRFADLAANDILFIDSSHVIRPYGDVLREFQEILPSLAPGVLVHVHDVFTPRDYPDAWLRAERRLWNEQYLLEAFLAFNTRFAVLCANNWLKHNHWDAFSRACPMTTPDYEPGSFWMQVNG
jgi:predicted O-methyltransferase YrrM